MAHYGYLDMPEGYSDVSTENVMATCRNCGHQVEASREDCWEEDGQLVTDCMCSELPDPAEAAAPDMLKALQEIACGFADGSITFTRTRQSDSDPYHKANVLMCAAIEKASHLP